MNKIMQSEILFFVFNIYDYSIQYFSAGKHFLPSLKLKSLFFIDFDAFADINGLVAKI